MGTIVSLFGDRAQPTPAPDFQQETPEYPGAFTRDEQSRMLALFERGKRANIFDSYTLRPGVMVAAVFEMSKRGTVKITIRKDLVDDEATYEVVTDKRLPCSDFKQALEKAENAMRELNPEVGKPTIPFLRLAK